MGSIIFLSVLSILPFTDWKQFYIDPSISFDHENLIGKSIKIDSSTTLMDAKLNAIITPRPNEKLTGLVGECKCVVLYDTIYILNEFTTNYPESTMIQLTVANNTYSGVTFENHFNFAEEIVASRENIKLVTASLRLKKYPTFKKGENIEGISLMELDGNEFALQFKCTVDQN